MKRISVEHIKNGFDESTINFLFNEFESLAIIDNENKPKSEREVRLKSQGIMNDEIRLSFKWYKIWEKFTFLEKLGDFELVMYPVIVRNIRDSNKHNVPWHQDSAYMAALPASKKPSQVITCFVPMEKKPIEHSTIQFAYADKQTEEQFWEHQSFVGNYGLGIEDKKLPDIKSRFHFELELGDSLIFGDRILHRTFVPNGKLSNRKSLEFRLIKRKDMKKDYDYYDLKKKQFISA